VFTALVITFIFAGILLIRGLSSYGKYGHDCTFKHKEVHFMALQVSGHRTEDTSQGPQIGQITYHL